MPTSLYQTLTAEREQLAREEAQIVEAATAAGGLTDEHRERLKAIDERVTAIDADLSALEKARDRARSAPAAIVDEEIVEAAAAASERALAALPRPFGGSRALGEQLIAVAKASKKGAPVDARLIEYEQAVMGAAAGLNERVDSEGGFLVQHDVSNELLQEAYDSGQVVSRTRQRPVTGTGIKIRAVDETSRADGARMGGIQAFWTGEADEFQASKPKFRVIDQDLDKLTGLYYATDELLEDADALQAEVEGWFTEEFSFKFDDAVLRGTGAGMPLGVLNSGALITQAAEGGQAADSLVTKNLHNMFARMRPRSLARAAWFINQEVWPQLFGLEDSEGHLIYLPGGRLNEAPFGTILGLPVYPIEQASALGDVGDVTLMDLNQYLWIRKGGIQAATSIHVEFLTGQTAFRFVVRANGQPIPAAPITPYKGSNTLSPFVALAAR